MSKKIIVTGANGQLGSEIKTISGSYAHTFIYTDIDELDLTIRNDVFSFLDSQTPDIVINCAAYTAVDKAEENKELAFKLNAGLPEMLREYSDRSTCKIIHISTDYVFSGESFIPLKETDPTSPKSVYGQSKRKGEEALLNSPNAIIIRTSWLYSSYGNNFVKSMLRLLAERDELKIVFDQIGTPTYAADLSEAILRIVDNIDSDFIPGIYHYSNEGIASWYDFAFEINQMRPSTCKIKPIETRDYPLPASRPMYAVLNKEKIKKQFKLDIPHWKSSLHECLKRIN